MTERKAILHIGTMKTGTSSIQATLGQSPLWLAKRGWAFHLGAHRTSERIAQRIRSNKDDRNLILSDEGLWHFANSDRSDTKAIAQLLKSEGYAVTVIAYFRKPDAFLESWFMQGLKNGLGHASFTKFEKSSFARAGCNFYGRLKIFADLFGKEAIQIAPYEKAQWAQGDVVTDFLVRCGFAGPDDTHESLIEGGLKYPPKQNVSPNANVILLVSLLRQLGHLPEDALKLTLNAVPPDAARDVGRILRPDEVTAINARYLPVFRRLQAEYGGGAGPDFFVDWSAKADVTGTCVMRDVYDRLIDLPVPKPLRKVAPSAVAPPAPKPVVVAPVAMPRPPARINVVFAIQKLTGLTGGAERVFIETAEAMASRGLDVRIVTFDPGVASSPFGSGVIPMQSLFPQREGARMAAGLAVRLLKAAPNISPLTHLKWRLSHGVFVRQLRADLVARPADVVVAFLPPAIAATAFATAGLATRFVASTHNVPEQDFGDGPRWDQNPLYRVRAREALRRAAGVTVLMPSFRAWFPAVVRQKVAVLPNPVKRLSTAVPELQRDKVILGVGRLTRIKRWDLLISAFAQIVPDLPGWQVHLYGEGSEQAALQAQIDGLGLSRRVCLMGTSSEIGTIYDGAAMLVHPSEFEGFGLSVAEAMAHGLPVVAFDDCDGVNSLISHGEDGLLVPRGTKSVDNLAAALVHLAGDADLRVRLGKAAIKIAERFDAAQIYAKWATLLRQVAGK